MKMDNSQSKSLKVKEMKRYLGVFLAAVFGVLVTLALTGNFPGDKSKKSVLRVEHSSPLQVSSARYGTADGLLDFTESAEIAMPAVVHIKSTSTRRPTSQQNQMPDLFREFFGPQTQRPSVGSGSGVILTDDGYIVTNNHVIDNADGIEVILNDNRSFEAKVVGVDPLTDMAVIKIEAEDLPTLAIANSDNVKVGQWVLAVGNPFSLNSTATAGIVSAVGRNINILRDQAAIESFIQTDAAINPGNSGGALVNLDGQLVGINTAIASPTGSYSGYGFAVPSNLMRKVVEDLMEFGQVQRGYLGVMIRNVDASLAEEKDLEVTSGVYVSELVPNGAAAEAGVKAGDVIRSVDGRNVRTSPELQAAIGMHRPGDEVELIVDRDGSEKTLSITLKNGTGNTELVAAADNAEVMQKLGAELAEVEGGVKINKLLAGKLSQQTDIREGFVIKRINDEEVKSIADVERILNNRKGGVMLEGSYENYPGTYYYAFGM